MYKSKTVRPQTPFIINQVQAKTKENSDWKKVFFKGKQKYKKI